LWKRRNFFSSKHGIEKDASRGILEKTDGLEPLKGLPRFLSR
jgi:hypothetical protein